MKYHQRKYLCAADMATLAETLGMVVATARCICRRPESDSDTETMAKAVVERIMDSLNSVRGNRGSSVPFTWDDARILFLHVLDDAKAIAEIPA